LYFTIPNPTAAVFFKLAEILCVDLNYFSESFQSEDDEPAFKMTIDNIGDNEQTVQEVVNLSPSPERQLLTNFSGSNLPKSDFAGVTVPKGKFEGSAMMDKLSYNALRGMGVDLSKVTILYGVKNMQNKENPGANWSDR